MENRDSRSNICSPVWRIGHKFACLIFSLFCLSSCGAVSSTSHAVFGPGTGKLDEICEAHGGLRSPGPLYVDGYYLPSASPLFGTEEVITKLGQARFQYFEMDTAWVNKSGTWGMFDLRKIKGEGRYTRFYLAEKGDPHCTAFEEYLKLQRSSAKKKIIYFISFYTPFENQLTG